MRAYQQLIFLIQHVCIPYQSTIQTVFKGIYTYKMSIDNDNNSKKYNDIFWIGLTTDEVKEKIKEVFGDSVRYIFEKKFRITEQYCLNLITFIIVDNKVVDSRWG